MDLATADVAIILASTTAIHKRDEQKLRRGLTCPLVFDHGSFTHGLLNGSFEERFFSYYMFAS